MRPIAEYIELIGLIMTAAKDDGYDVEDLVTKTCALHLMSSETDQVHMNGISFCTKLDIAMMELAVKGSN